MQAALGRADFKTMTGLGDRLSTQLLTSLLRRGFLATDSAYGKVRFAVPRHGLCFLLSGAVAGSGAGWGTVAGGSQHSANAIWIGTEAIVQTDQASRFFGGITVKLRF